MKKIKKVQVTTILFSISLVLFFTGCAKKGISYSFSPIQERAGITQEEKDKVEELLKSAPKMPKGISFYSYEIQKAKDGSLKVNGFVRNNTGDDVCNIFGAFRIESDDKKFASADFSLDESTFGVLKNGDSRPWSLIYNKHQVLSSLEDIDSYVISVDVEYEILN